MSPPGLPAHGRPQPKGDPSPAAWETHPASELTLGTSLREASQGPRMSCDGAAELQAVWTPTHTAQPLLLTPGLPPGPPCCPVHRLQGEPQARQHREQQPSRAAEAAWLQALVL